MPLSDLIIQIGFLGLLGLYFTTQVICFVVIYKMIARIQKELNIKE